jgi:transcriptional regulator of aromatic amino acid metabolism
MANEAEVKKIIESMDPTSLSIDKDGKIIIKDEAAREALEKLPPENRSGTMSNYVNCNC